MIVYHATLTVDNKVALQRQRSSCLCFHGFLNKDDLDQRDQTPDQGQDQSQRPEWKTSVTILTRRTCSVLNQDHVQGFMKNEE